MVKVWCWRGCTLQCGHVPNIKQWDWLETGVWCTSPSRLPGSSIITQTLQYYSTTVQAATAHKNYISTCVEWHYETWHFIYCGVHLTLLWCFLRSKKSFLHTSQSYLILKWIDSWCFNKACFIIGFVRASITFMFVHFWMYLMCCLLMECVDFCICICPAHLIEISHTTLGYQQPKLVWGQAL